MMEEGRMAAGFTAYVGASVIAGLFVVGGGYPVGEQILGGLQDRQAQDDA